MKAGKLIAVAALIMALGTPVLAHQEVSAEDYDGAMKSIRGAMGAVRGQMSEEDAAGLGASGTTFIEGFTKAQAYWQAREEEQAIELATAALMASQRFQEAGAAGAFAAARAAIGDLRGTCMACHQQYRERDADGNWRIKSGS